MAAILDVVNKSLSYVAEMYFIGFCWPWKHKNKSLVTKSIFLAGLEMYISQKLEWVTVYGHGGDFEKCIFSLFGHFERVTRSNICSHNKSTNKIKEPYMPDLATKCCFMPLLRFVLTTIISMKNNLQQCVMFNVVRWRITIITSTCTLNTLSNLSSASDPRADFGHEPV